MEPDPVEVLQQLQSADDSCRRRILRALPPTEDRGILRGVAACLGDPSPAVCEAAVEALVGCQNGVAASVAARRLQSDDPRERGYALSALVRLGSHAAATGLELLASQDRDLRRYGIELLAAIKSHEALPALTAHLSDSDANVAAAAAEALGTIGSREAVPALAEIVQKGPDWLCYVAITSLASIAGPEAARAICSVALTRPNFVLAAAAKALPQTGCVAQTDFRAFLMRLLNTDDEGTRELAFAAVAQTLDGSILPQREEITALTCAALEAVDSTLPEVRAAAANCLATVGYDDESTLRRLCHDPEPMVRVAALTARLTRGAVGTEELLEIAAKRDEAEQLRVLAINPLCRFPASNGDGVDETLDAIVREDKSPTVRAAALAALIARRSELALSAAVVFAGEDSVFDDDSVIAELQACSIQDLAPIATHLIKSGDMGAVRAAVKVLFPVHRACEIDPSPLARGAVVAAACHPDWMVRAHAFRLLSACKAEWARQVIEEGCCDSEPRVRVRAIEALCQVGILPEEVPILRDRLIDGNGWVRAKAVQELGQCGFIDETAIVQALSDEFRPVRRAALEVASDMIIRGCSREFGTLVQKAASEAVNTDDEEAATLAEELLRGLSQC